MPLPGWVLDVGVAVSQVYQFGAAARSGGGGGGELPLVIKIHGHRHPADENRFDPGHPGEIGIPQEPIIILDGAEIMAPGVAVALGIKHPRVCFRDAAGNRPILFANIVVERVGHFPAVDAAGEIPDQPIVKWICRDRWQARIIPAAQQSQFFFHQRRGLIHEAKDRSRGRAINMVVRAKGDGRVRRIGESFVAQEHVKIPQPSGGQEQRVVGRSVIDTGRSVDAQALPPAQNGFVRFDQAEIVRRSRIQSHRTAVGRAGLADHADDRVDLVVLVRAEPLLERIDPAHHPLHPAFGEHGRRPVAPTHGIGLAHAQRRSDRSVTADEIIVADREQTRSLNRDVHRALAGPGVRRERGPLIGRSG